MKAMGRQVTTAWHQTPDPEVGGIGMTRRVSAAMPAVVLWQSAPPDAASRMEQCAELLVTALFAAD